MGIRKRFTPAAPPDVEFALQLCSNGLVYGQPGASVTELLNMGVVWQNKGHDASAFGNDTYAEIANRHAERYFSAAEAVDKYERSLK